MREKEEEEEEQKEEGGEGECRKTEQESKDGRKVDGRWRIDSLHLGSNCLAPPGSGCEGSINFCTSAVGRCPVTFAPRSLSLCVNAKKSRTGAVADRGNRCSPGMDGK